MPVRLVRVRKRAHGLIAEEHDTARCRFPACAIPGRDIADKLLGAVSSSQAWAR
ncbi:hypothetical protein [Desulfosoma caldarium]|nr:hypothetical protein [Desulfosoma caldarium]